MAGRVYVVAGELSGDTHGAGLLRALRQLHPGLEIAGAGGPEMQAVGGVQVRDWVEDAAVVGLWEVLKRYKWFKSRFDEMLAEFRLMRPEVLLLVDYPGFNLRFAEAVKNEFPATRIVYYISPQVWAWNRGRIPKMVRLLDEMLCLFPFEQPIFEDAGLKTTFVGHPLVDELDELRRPGSMVDESLIGLFPGSREREVARLFPMMIEMAKTLGTKRPELRFEAPAASPKLAVMMRSMIAIAKLGKLIQVTDGGSHFLMQRAACGVIASGTATLEAACYGLPYCLVYKVAWPTYIVGSLLVKLEYIGLVNILAGEEVVEEFIQAEAEPVSVGGAIERFLDEPHHRQRVREGLSQTAAKLGGPGAHLRAAQAVDFWLRRPA
jgi:lipid-A-disaccharide synthase